MKLQNLLAGKKASVVRRWLELIQGTYPGETSVYLKKGEAPFRNPVAETFAASADALVSALAGEMDRAEVLKALDGIVRIRAVQEFSAQQAVAFVFLLKPAIRGELEKQVGEHGLYSELLDLESRIDALALMAFDIYSRCREKVYEIRANDLKRRTHRLLEKSSWISTDFGSEGTDEEPARVTDIGP